VDPQGSPVLQHDPVLGAGIQCLSVKVPFDFHMVRDKTQRHQNNTVYITGGFLNRVVYVGFKPRHGRRAGP